MSILFVKDVAICIFELVSATSESLPSDDMSEPTRWSIKDYVDAVAKRLEDQRTAHDIYERSTWTRSAYRGAQKDVAGYTGQHLTDPKTALKIFDQTSSSIRSVRKRFWAWIGVAFGAPAALAGVFAIGGADSHPTASKGVAIAAASSAGVGLAAGGVGAAVLGANIALSALVSGSRRRELDLLDKAMEFVGIDFDLAPSAAAERLRSEACLTTDKVEVRSAIAADCSRVQRELKSGSIRPAMYRDI